MSRDELIVAFGLPFSGRSTSQSLPMAAGGFECNPAGQWGWIAEETGLPIAEAIAEELVRAA